MAAGRPARPRGGPAAFPAGRAAQHWLWLGLRQALETRRPV